MDGSSWVGLAGVAAAFATTVFTLWWQRRGERERRTEDQAVRKDQQWIDLRREVYTQFLRGTDECARTLRARFNWLHYGYSDDDPAVPQEDRPSATSEGLQVCADALAEMRLFAPADVTKAAVAYIGHARYLDYFSSIEVALAGMPDRPRSNVDEMFGDSVKSRDEAISNLVAAMREDLGAEPTETVELSNIDPQIYGC